MLTLDAPEQGGAAALGLRRQDHHLSQARRSGARQARAVFPAMGPAWTAGRLRCPAATFPYVGAETRHCRLCQAATRSSRPLTRGASYRLRHPGATVSCDEVKRTRRSRHAGSAPISAKREIEYLRARNGRRPAEDVLWRRSKLGLHCAADQRAASMRLCSNAVSVPAMAASARYADDACLRGSWSWRCRWSGPYSSDGSGVGAGEFERAAGSDAVGEDDVDAADGGAGSSDARAEFCSRGRT